MKKYLILILLMMPLFALGQKRKNRGIYKPVRSFYLDLNNDGLTDTINTSVSNKQTEYYFDRIIIKLAGFPKKIFYAKTGWAQTEDFFLNSNKNLLRSKNVFIKKTPLHTVIIISAGTDGAGYGGEFSIINIENNQVKMVFDDNGALDIEIPTELSDMKKDGRLDFVYKDYQEVYKSAKGGMIGTYMPYFVYAVTDSYRLDTGLTIAYNKAHYVYAGLKFSDKIQVYYPNNKKLKPKVWYIPKDLR